MAILIPDVPEKCPNSERLVYERLGRELPDDWVVLHSLGLPGHEKKIWGEADMIVLSTFGVFALEVKGGKVTCADGVWTFSGDFKSYSKRESPWSQASGAMNAVRDRLNAASGSFKDVLFGFGVVMPYTTFTTPGAEIVPEVLLDKRQFRDTLGHFVSAIQRYWNTVYLEKRGKTYRGLRLDEILLARQVLRPDLETALSLGGYLTGVDARLIHLSNEQIRASRRLAANPRTVVRGSAGTGKSVIALERARQLAKDGKRVLMLCFNQLLAAHVRDGLAAEPGSSKPEVRHVHALYRELIVNAGLLPQLEAEDSDHLEFFPKRFPELAADALCERATEQWDVLIVDEAQDLLTPEHLDVMDLLVRGGLSRGQWHLFLDPLQNIYGVETQEMVDLRLAAGAPAFDDLFENCRNTRQVAVQASIVSGIDLAVAGAPDGPQCHVHYHTNKEDGIAQLEAIVRELIARDVPARDIAILSTRRHENSLLAGQQELAGRRLADPSNVAALRGGSLLLTTMHAFKGLERQVVIAIDMAEIGEGRWAMLHYAGLSRARGLLHVLMPTTARRAYDRQGEAFGRRLETRRS
ncbi:AAA family ATPase [Paracoccus limosus]|uniref:DNA 3'-5' helicase II n=1 Tax=Paracoccus limosus TaxID=913252 RepID=A0A844H8S8_9RHOB|nr:NERD domain-containing protein [Paracoccus limosus]MTH35990.1 AAA family ATPase [Paracoccus limosus]